MASFRKRGDRWRAEIFVNGKRSSKTFSTKKQAQLWANEKELELESASNAKIIPGKTMSDAFNRYARKVSITKKGARWEAIRLEALERYEIANLKIADICTGDIAHWRDTRLREDVKPATVRREMQLISSVLAVARKEWHWIDGDPMRDFNARKTPSPVSGV